ncbi:hypothetical protein B0H34DRAFT_785807 [Crassisporium funariophilum]|nr:hypothetical protein B0H34DRAFT_785807 [Crassisporium funariophilum]
MFAERHSSPSPGRRISLTNKISALGAKLGRTLSHSSDSPSQKSEEYDFVAPILAKTNNDRSVSRGREAFQSTGRGGLGNIRQTSLSRDARPDSGPDDFSITRGREPLSSPTQKVYSTGRGGAGNIRSPSRDVSKPPAVETVNEDDVIKEYKASQEGAAFSTGRGGLGNIDRSRSREPTNKPVYSTGRGGAGNIKSGDGGHAEAIDEDERRKYSTANEGFHSTGRGGAANITSAPEPAVERAMHVSHREYESTGRGGAGNIVKDRSASRTRG